MSLNHSHLLQAVDETYCLNFLSKLVQFKSYSNTPGETEIARFLAEQMTALGLTADLQPVENGRFNTIGT